MNYKVNELILARRDKDLKFVFEVLMKNVENDHYLINPNVKYKIDDYHDAVFYFEFDGDLSKQDELDLDAAWRDFCSKNV